MRFKDSIKQVIETRDTLTGRVFDGFIQILIIASLVTFSIETLPGLSDKSRALLRYFEIFTISIFTIEYALRLCIADKPLKFARSLSGVIDLIAILPFYITLGMDIRIDLRAVRVFRLLRLLKLVRYSSAIQRFHRAFLIAKDELILFLSVTIIIIFLAGVGIYYFENSVQPKNFASIFHSLWWAVATLTTVGYGDIYPVTAGGKIFTFIILLVGLGIIAMPAALMASALSKAREEAAEELQKQLRR